MKTTIKDLRESVANFNHYQLNNCSTVLLEESGRNGYQAVDVHIIKSDGSLSCERMLEGGTSREVINAVNNLDTSYEDNLNKRITREQAVFIAKTAIDCSKDYYELDFNSVTLLSELANKCGYRKSKTSSCSLIHAFYININKPKYNHIKAVNYLS